MAGIIVIGICNICNKEVEEKDFSREGYKQYRNVVHTGQCFETFKEREEKYRSKIKKQEEDKIEKLERRIRILEKALKDNGIEIYLDSEGAGVNV